MKRGLGRGLDALIPSSNDKSDQGVLELKVNDIEPNINQPRKKFNLEELQSLAESIKAHGIVQPIIVSKKKDKYQIIAGERRWRACKMVGITTIPAIVKEYANDQILQIALIENIQRQDLNPLEEARAYQKLSDDYKFTQEYIADQVGKSRSAVANLLRLLTLDPRVQEMIIGGAITAGHAKILINFDPDTQFSLATQFEKHNLSVREAEALIKNLNRKETKKPKKQDFSDITQDITEKLKKVLGTKVQLKSSGSKGKIIIDYYSKDELDRLLELMYNIN